MVITRIAPMSVARIAAVLYAVFGLVAGAFLSLATMAGAMDDAEGGFPRLLVGIGAIVVLPFVYSAIGFVMALVATSLYNVVASTIGGIRVDVE